MAAGNFLMYQKGMKYILQGNIRLETDVIIAVPVHFGYTPLTASHSAKAQVTAFQATAGGTPVIEYTLDGVLVTSSGTVALKFDSDDIDGFTAAAVTFEVKYVALYAQSASAGGTDGLLIGWFDTETTDTTGVEGVKINVTVPSGGWFKVNTNAN